MPSDSVTAPVNLSLELLQHALGQAGAERDWLSVLGEMMTGERDALLNAVGELSGYPVINLIEPAQFTIDPTHLSLGRMLALGLALGHDEQHRLCAVMGAPFAPAASEWLANCRVPVAEVYLADPQQLKGAMTRLEATVSAVASAVVNDDDANAVRSPQGELSLAGIQGEASPAVRLVDSTLFDALRHEASDIHLESDATGLVIKFRIDGVLNRIAQMRNLALAEQVIARVKVLAELDIGEKRIPQDGRFRVVSKGRDIDIRVSIMPSIHGEDAVLRILDKQALIDQMQRLTLDTLGFDAPTIQTLRRLAAEPYGMLLVTGPTGSGKTTTLYAALSEINRGEDKLITIEDPVEYQLGDVLQIPVNEKKGLTFAVGLRSILRHDPDKILVGEIRDPETAQIAVQAALTGHLVFTSVHANNTFDVIGRFMHMGVDPYSFVSSLSGVVAQRLIRQICSQCAQPVEPTHAELTEAGISDPSAYRFLAGAGCAHCRGTGYRGRKAVAEVLRLTDEIRELIIARASIRTLKEQARKEGTRFLREVALAMVQRGETTLQEVNRVTFVA